MLIWCFSSYCASLCWNTTALGWRMRHRVCFTFSLESLFSCSAQCSDTRWMRMKYIQETAATANEFQHLNGLRRLSETSSFPVHTLKEARLRKGCFLHWPLNSPLLHRSENYMIINHSLAPLESKQYPSQCEDLWSSLFPTCCGFRGIFRCFYCRKGLWTACVNRPHTDTFIDDQRGLHADLFSAESSKKNFHQRDFIWNDCLFVCKGNQRVFSMNENQLFNTCWMT